MELLQEKIKEAALEFISEHYGETEDDACYCIDALATYITEYLVKKPEPKVEEPVKKELVAILKVEEGVCPYCGGTDIDYGTLEVADSGFQFYPAHCRGCDRDFEEWYECNFTGHNVGDDLCIEASKGMKVEMIATEKKLESGRRIMCIHMKDDPQAIPDGMTGTIDLIDDLGDIHVSWDNGRTLALVPEADEYALL